MLVAVAIGCLLHGCGTAGALTPTTHWSALRVSDSGRGQFPPEWFGQLKFTDAKHGWLLVGTDAQVVRGPASMHGAEVTIYRGGRLLRTADGGNSWQSAWHSAWAGVQAIDLLRNAVGWLSFDTRGGDSVVWRTLDGGATWIRNRPQDISVVDLCAISDKEAWGIADGGAGPVHSLDGGASWKWVDLPRGVATKDCQAVFFADARHGWIVGYHGQAVGLQSFLVLRTQDGGKTFAVARAPVVSVNGPEFRIHFRNLSEGWIAFGGSSLLHSVDGGRTWQVVTPVIRGLRDEIHLVDCAFPTAVDGWAVGDVDDRQALAIRTRDRGKTWTREETGAEDTTDAPPRPAAFWETRLERVAFSDTRHGWIIGSGWYLPPGGAPNRLRDTNFILKYVP